MNQLTATKPAALRQVNAQALANVIWPVGKCRLAVRGLRASNSRSTMRLNPIAAVRAQTIAARINPTTRPPGHPRAATTIAANANGNANTVCENRTNSKYFRRFNAPPRQVGGTLPKRPTPVNPPARSPTGLRAVPGLRGGRTPA